MSYDYHGKWDLKTGHNAPLYPKSEEDYLNVEYTLNFLFQKGAKAEKTVLGVPLYGRAFMLVDQSQNGFDAKAESTSFQGPYTREDGFLGYNEICEELMEQDNPWTSKFDQDHQAPYMFKGKKWISYDDEKSIRLKSEFAFDKGLAGVMVWSIETDDFKGICGQDRFPLLRTINNALHQRQHNVDSTTVKPTTAGADLMSNGIILAIFCGIWNLL